MKSVPYNKFSQLQDVGDLHVSTHLSSESTINKNNKPKDLNKHSTLAKYQESSVHMDLEGLEINEDLSFSKFSHGSGESVILSGINATNPNSVNESPFVKRIRDSMDVKFDDKFDSNKVNDRLNEFQNERIVYPIGENSKSEDENGDSPFVVHVENHEQKLLHSNKLRNKSTIPNDVPPRTNKLISTPKHQRTSSVKVSLTPAQKFEKRSNTRSDNALDNFEFIELVGIGAFASVYRAVNLKTNQVVAIKQILLEKDQDVGILMREIDLLKILKHRNIVKYHGFVKTSTSLNVLLEYCAGGSLRQLYKKLKKGLPESQIINYVRQILLGLTYLHDQGVVHRDVKAANVLLTETGDVKLADFGVATRINSQHYTLVGTPNWMAPETVLGGEGLCTASDIWSLGATIIELFTTNPPYHDLNPMATLHAIGTDEHPPLPKNISSVAKDFLLECFQKQPNLRISGKLLLKHKWLSNGVNSASNSRLANSNIPRPGKRPSIELKSIRMYSEANEENWDNDFAEVKMPKFQIALAPDLLHIDDVETELQQDTAMVQPPQSVASKSELLNKFAEDDDELEADTSSVFPNLKTKLLIHRNGNTEEEEEAEESDPFLNIDIENFNTNELEIQSKMEYLVVRLSRKLDQAHSGNEEAIGSLVKLTGRMLHLIKKYPISHDIFVRDHGVLSLLELLDSHQEMPRQQELWCHVLSILNYIFESNVSLFENFCFLGGIPAIAHFRNVTYDLQVRLQVARFVGILNTSDKALSMFVSCGGLRLVSKFVEEDLDTTPTFPLVSIECIHNVLSKDLTRSKSDICRILSKYGVIFWFVVLLNRLLKCGKKPLGKQVTMEEIQTAIDRIVDIVKYFEQSEARVRVSIASADLFKLMIRIQLVNVKLVIYTPAKKNYKEVINIVSPIIYNCISLNQIRAGEIVELGAVPYLKSLSIINLPFRQFILPLVCEFVYCDSKVRSELRKNDILSIYFNLILDPYWQSNALDSIRQWHQSDPRHIRLDTPRAAECLVAGFLIPKPSNIESTLDSYLQLMTTNAKVTKFMSNATIINNILMKLSIYNKTPVIQLSLLKILKWLLHYLIGMNQLAETNVSNPIKNTLTSLKTKNSSVLIEELALEIIDLL
ncbi:CDC15 [[Candida] subhashii]|uniref:non-specific serine/threonine protein kinase n=1 Tax=[Candida] subhashii TaxID=561895 RepID=A0A8J5UUI8_9ASCO|nr:CDC15 [[Candida] subhashii]KAG7665927.1 CDC15 [[Candida] subhashii]